MATTVNVATPRRRYSRPYAITISDTVADDNLKRNGVSFMFIQNLGTGGLVNIIWEDGAEVSIGLAQFQVMDGGLWRHAKSTGTTTPGTGVILRGFLAMGGGADR